MDDKLPQPPTELGLDSNELNSLDTESENPDYTSPPISTSQQPLEIKECVKITNNNYSYELYSSCLPVDQLANILLQLHTHLNKSKENKSYVG